MVVDYPDLEGTYAELHWPEGGGHRRAYLETKVLLPLMLGVESAVPAECVDERVLLALVTDYCQQADSGESLNAANVLGVVSGRALPTALYRLMGGEVDLLLDEVPEAGGTEPDPDALQWLATHLRWPLSLCLGRSQLNALQLSGLALGDVVLLTDPQGYARIPGKRLFYTQFDGEVMVMTQAFEVDEPSDFAQAPFDPRVDELPVAVEFVLAERSYSLAELCALAPGEVLELGAGTARHIQLRAGQQLLAEGELVALGEHLGVELTRVRLRG
jgi:type III secretion system YscQ/HrcQ family protein